MKYIVTKKLFLLNNNIHLFKDNTFSFFSKNNFHFFYNIFKNKLNQRMKIPNVNCEGKENQIKSTFWILSVLSWFLFILISFISLGSLDNDRIIITFYRPYQKNNLKYKPLQVASGMLYIIMLSTITFSTISFILHMIKSTCKKDDNFYNKMFGQYTRFHFLIFIFHISLFLIGIFQHNFEKRTHSMCSGGIILVICSLFLLGIIYHQTDLDNIFHSFFIKKATYSSLISIDWYYFCYVICQLYSHNNHDSIKKINNISFSFIFIMGFLIGIFAFYFNDVIVCIYYFLIYMGIILFNSTVNKSFENKDLGVTEIVFSVLFMLGFLALAIWIILKEQMKIFK